MAVFLQSHTMHYSAVFSFSNMGVFLGALILNSFVIFDILDATDVNQPVDAGYGRLLKQKIRQQTEQWLQTGENMDIWMGNSTETLTVSTRRILITQWVGEANKILMDEKYDGFSKLLPTPS